MFQLAKIERYEPRLNCMAYMGNFDELIGTTQPVSAVSEETQLSGDWIIIIADALFHYIQQIEAVLSASLSLFRSSRLRKVFEVRRTNLHSS